MYFMRTNGSLKADLNSKDQSAETYTQIHNLKGDIADLIVQMDSWPPLDPSDSGKVLIANNATNRLVDHVDVLQEFIDRSVQMQMTLSK